MTTGFYYVGSHSSYVMNTAELATPNTSMPARRTTTDFETLYSGETNFTVNCYITTKAFQKIRRPLNTMERRVPEWHRLFRCPKVPITDRLYPNTYYNIQVDFVNLDTRLNNRFIIGQNIDGSPLPGYQFLYYTYPAEKINMVSNTPRYLMDCLMYDSSEDFTELMNQHIHGVDLYRDSLSINQRGHIDNFWNPCVFVATRTITHGGAYEFNM